MKLNNNVKLLSKKLLLLMLIIFIVLVLLFIVWSKNSISRGKEISYTDIIRQSDKKVWTFSDKDILIKFIDALNNKQKTKAKIDIRTPDYYVKIYFVDKSMEEYKLWIDKNDNIRGVLMKGNETWYINKKSNHVLKELLK